MKGYGVPIFLMRLPRTGSVHPILPIDVAGKIVTELRCSEDGVEGTKVQELPTSASEFHVGGNRLRQMLNTQQRESWGLTGVCLIFSRSTLLDYTNIKQRELWVSCACWEENTFTAFNAGLRS